MTFPILASLLVRLVVLLPFQLLRLSLATPSRWTPLDRKSGSAGMPRPISYAVFCLKKKTNGIDQFRTVFRVRQCHDGRLTSLQLFLPLDQNGAATLATRGVS